MRGACHFYIVVLVIASRYQGYNVGLAAVANAIREDIMHSAPYPSKKCPIEVWEWEPPSAA